MMTQNELLADGLGRNLEFLKATLGDFSDAEMLVRPCPGANHAAWQLGHLVVAEHGMINAVKPGAMPELPPGFKEKFNPDTTKNDDPKFFPGKSQLLEQLEKMRHATIQWA